MEADFGPKKQLFSAQNTHPWTHKAAAASPRAAAILRAVDILLRANLCDHFGRVQFETLGGLGLLQVRTLAAR